MADVIMWLGGLLVLAAVSWAVAVVWDSNGPGGALAVLTGGIIIMIGVRWWAGRNGQQLGSDLLLTGLIAAVLLWTLTLFDWTDAWYKASPGDGWARGLLTDGFVPWGLLALFLGVMAAWRNPFTLLAWPLLVGFWAGFVGLLIDTDRSQHWILAGGAVLFLAGWAMDVIDRRAQAWWVHAAALLTVLDIFSWATPVSSRIFALFAVGVAALVVALLLGRALYLVAAIAAFHACIGWIITEWLGGSLWAPVALFFVGLSFLGLGVKLTLDRDRVEAAVLAALPDWLVGLGARPHN